MKSKCTRFVVVLIFVFVVMSFLFPSGHGLMQESVALADVQAAVTSQETLFSTGTRTAIWQKKPAFIPPPFKTWFDQMDANEGPFELTMNAETYMSPMGFATHMVDLQGIEVFSLAVEFQDREVIILLPTVKMFMQFQIPEAYHGHLSALTLDGMMDGMFRSHGEIQEQRKEIDGIEAVGFEVHDMIERFLGEFNPALIRYIVNFNQEETCVWVDPATKLPIQTVGEYELDGCLITFCEKAHLSVVDETFTWGVEIDNDIFSPEIPTDYQKLDPLAPAKQAAWMGALPVGLVGWCCWRERRRRKAGRMRSKSID